MLIDSSGAVLVCALAVGDSVIVEQTADPRGPYIGGMIQQLLTDHKASCLDGIVVGIGPGSFIGTRTAISFANGYAAGRNLPLWGVNSLAAFAAVRENESAVLRDARRGQWYLWTPEGDCSICDEFGCLDRINAMGLGEIIVERVTDQRVPESLIDSGLTVNYVSRVPPLGILLASLSETPQTYAEPIYLRGFT